MTQTISDFIDPVVLLWNHKLLTIGGIKLGLGNLIVALALLLFASRLSRLMTKLIDHRLIQKFVDDRNSRITYQTFAFYGCLAVFVTLSLGIAGIPLTVFTVFGGALAIGVGFGSQNIVNNFISGIIILVEQPIKVGDIVELENIAGSVVSIGTRSTRVKNAEGKIFVVPNSFFLEKSVLNWSYEDTLIKSVVTFGVAYQSDIKLVENICTDILLNSDSVLQEPLPLVVFENFSESNLEFQLHFWVDLSLGRTPLEIRSAIRFKINQKFKQHNIEMAFPQRELNLKTGEPLNVKILT